MKHLGCHYCCEKAVGTGRQVCSDCEALNYLNTMNHYETLGVASDASPDEIKRAFRKKSSQHHPDKPGGNAEAMAAVNAAYECLGDPVRRLGYDQTGRDPAQGPTLDDVAEHALQSLIRQILEDSPEGNLVKLLDGHITRAITGIQQDLTIKERRVARLGKQLDRVVRKSAGRTSLFNRVLQQQIQQAESEIAQGRQQLEVSQRSLEILRDHEDTRPQHEPVASMRKSFFDEVIAHSMVNRTRGFAG